MSDNRVIKSIDQPIKVFGKAPEITGNEPLAVLIAPAWDVDGLLCWNMQVRRNGTVVRRWIARSASLAMLSDMLHMRMQEEIDERGWPLMPGDE